MLSGPAQKMSRERLREIKKKDDISDTYVERVGTKDVERETERDRKKRMTSRTRMLSGSAQKMSRERLREIKKKG
jgi:hypothetical protein